MTLLGCAKWALICTAAISLSPWVWACCVDGIANLKRSAEARRKKAADRAQDPRSTQQLHAGAKLERTFEAMRRERGIDRHGRLLPVRRGPRGETEVIDLSKYSVRRQAL